MNPTNQWDLLRTFSVERSMKEFPSLEMLDILHDFLRCIATSPFANERRWNFEDLLWPVAWCIPPKGPTRVK